MVTDLMFAVSLAMGCGGTPMDQLISIIRDRNYSKQIDTLGMEQIVRAPANEVWKALPTVLSDLGLEVNFLEPETKRMGACYQKVRVRLAKETLSTYVDCGDSRGLPNADRYEVAMTVLVSVSATSPTTTKAYVFVLGVGLDTSGAASKRLWCFSKGALEDRIRMQLEVQTRA